MVRYNSDNKSLFSCLADPPPVSATHTENPPLIAVWQEEKTGVCGVKWGVRGEYLSLGICQVRLFFYMLANLPSLESEVAFPILKGNWELR